MVSDDETLGGTRRRRTDADRQTIVREAFDEGCSVSAVAERHGVSCASIYLWRRQARKGASGSNRKAQVRAHPPSPVTLVPVRVATVRDAATSGAPARSEPIEIALANGRILKVCEGIDPMRLARLVSALESGAP